MGAVESKDCRPRHHESNSSVGQFAERRRKPLLVNLTWAVILIVSGVTAYVVSYGATLWLLGRGALSDELAQQLDETVYLPLVSWGGPGADTFNVFSDWCYWQGAGEPKSWQQVDEDHQEWMKRFEPGGVEYEP